MWKEKIDFDEVIERKNTNSVKYDFTRHRGKPENVLPMWVADMDFKVSERILEALRQRVDHGIFGYSEVQGEYFEAVGGWMKKTHNWTVERSWLVKTPGVVFALAMAVQAFTEPGDAVLIQQPVYYPFHEVIEDNKRVVVDNTLVLGDDGKYHIDFDDFERKAEQYGVKLFLLCNPHNPVGRVFTREELEQLGEICLRKNILVVSDEIHQDFVYEGKHQVFADLSPELQSRTITCTSPSKTFNLAGLQISNIFIPDPKVRARFRKQVDAAGYSQLNTLGLTACEAAYRYGEEWQLQVLDYLKQNMALLGEYLKEKIPQIKLIKPEGTYLAWLDFRELGFTEEEKEELVTKKAGLWLDGGYMFGAGGAGFERINIACPRSVLLKALNNLEQAVLNL